MEPSRSRFSRTSRETRSRMHDTPFQEHGLVLLMFHVVSFWDVSEAVLKDKRASKSGLLKP